MKLKVDKEYCMSSFLTFRYVYEQDVEWKKGILAKNTVPGLCDERIACKTCNDVDEALKNMFNDIDLSHAALLLSGGIDSGILASYMPKKMKAYTVHNSSPITDLEVSRAQKICEINDLQHEVVEIDWKYYDEHMDLMMQNDRCPVTANEPQVFALVEKAKKDGAKLIILGDAADMVFGGLDKKLSRDWSFTEWIHEYTHVNPEEVLTNWKDMKYVYEKYRLGKDGIDYLRFLDEIFTVSSGNAYYNVFEYFSMNYFDPYTRLVMAEPLDLNKVRNGNSKYLLRELYTKKYPGLKIPEKLPMPRSMERWLDWWKGPIRSEFLPGCIEKLNYEQRFLVYSLERFLNLIEE